MDPCVNLVFVSGYAGSSSVKESRNRRKFLQDRLPECVVDEYSLSRKSAAERQFLFRASKTLLEQLRNGRAKRPARERELPIVFLVHGLGAFFVKQALILAAEEPRYQEISLYTSTIVFFGAAHQATARFSWEHLCLRLIMASRPPLDHPIKVAQYLMGELDVLSASFRLISSTAKVLNFYESRKYPLLDIECSKFGTNAETEIACDTRHEELWQLAPDHPISEKLCAEISATRNNKNSLFHDFFHQLSILDPQVHRLRPSFAGSASVDWICDDETFISWRQDPSVGIVGISGPPGSGATAVAARILGVLLEQPHSDNTAYHLTFSFDKNNAHARSAFDLYLSLCRQLLCSRPELFRVVSAVAIFFILDRFYTTDIVWALVQRIINHVLEDESVLMYCVVDGIDQCGAYQTDIIDRMGAFFGPSRGRFKLLLSGHLNMQMMSICSSTTALSIAVDSSSENMLLAKAQYVKQKIAQMTTDNITWSGLHEFADEKLSELPKDSPYLLVMLNMVLLEWMGSHSTRKTLREALGNQPTTLKEFYQRAMRTIDEEKRKWIIVALRWVAFAIRPLRPVELATAVALDDVQGSYADFFSRKDCSDEIRRDIVGDVNRGMTPLLVIQDSRVCFIHDTFRMYLLKEVFVSDKGQAHMKDTSLAETETQTRHGPEGEEPSSGDSHYSMLVTCVECLGSFVQRCAESFICDDGSLNSEWDLNALTSDDIFSPDWELGLLSYACLHWPYHFQHTNSKSRAQDFLLKVLRDGQQLKEWAKVFRLLDPTRDLDETSLDSPLKIVSSIGAVELVDHCIGLADSGNALQDQMEQSLDQAAWRGHDGVVQLLLDRGARSPRALGLAAKGGFQEVIEVLLAADCDPNLTDGRGYAPIHHATRGGHARIVWYLLKQGASVNTVTSQPTISASRQGEPGPSLTGVETEVLFHLAWSESALHLALLTGQLDIAKELLVHGADIHEETSSGYSAVHYAAIGGFPEAVTLLLNSSDQTTGTSITKASERNGNTALHLALACDNDQVAEIILQSSRERACGLVQLANFRHLTPIHIAAREGQLKLLKMMLRVADKSPDKDTVSIVAPERVPLRSRPPLFWPTAVPNEDHLAIRGRYVDVCKQLLEVTADRDGVERGKRVEQAVALIELRRPPVFSPPFTPDTERAKSVLELAAEFGRYGVVCTLLEWEAWVKPQDLAFGLNMAAQNGHAKVVAHLLRIIAAQMTQSSQALPTSGPPMFPSPFQITSDGRDGRTALHLAAQGGHKTILQQLLNAKIEHPERWYPVVGQPSLHHVASWFPVNHTTYLGSTPLHIVARVGHVGAMKVLLDHQADRDLIDDDSGKTALLLAAENGHLDCVRALLYHGDGADSRKAANRGQTTLHVAAKNGHMGVFRHMHAFQDILWDEDEAGNTAFDVLLERENIEEIDEFIRILGYAGNGDSGFPEGEIPLRVAGKGTEETESEVESEYETESEAEAEEEADEKVEMETQAEQGAEVAEETAEQIDRISGEKPEDVAEQKSEPAMRETAEHEARNDAANEVVEEEAEAAAKEVATETGVNDVPEQNPEKPEEVSAVEEKDEDEPGGEADDPERGSALTEDDKNSSVGDSPDHFGRALRSAITHNSLPIILRFLNHPRCNIASRDHRGRTALHLARSAMVAEALLAHGAANDLKDNYGETPLFAAAWGKFPEVVETLLVSVPELDIEVRDDEGWSALHAAYDSRPVTELLLKKGADINALCGEGRTPLAYAVMWNQIEVAKLLLEAGADASLARKIDEAPLFCAFESDNTGTLELLKLLVSHKNDLKFFVQDSDGDTALRFAVRSRKLSVVQYLIEEAEHVQDTKEVDIDDVYAGALCESVSLLGFDPKLAETFVKRISQDKIPETLAKALHKACQHGIVEAVKWCLDEMTTNDVRKQGVKVLFAAVESDQDATAKVALLLGSEYGIDVNVTDGNQSTALQRAAVEVDERPGPELVKMLLAKGADADLMFGQLDSPLNEAIGHGADLATIDYMMQKADISKPGHEGRMPIHVAAIKNRVDVVQRLVRAGAEPLAKDACGRSAFAHAVANRSMNVIECLLAEDYFDAAEADSTAHTALIVAARFGEDAMISTLLEKEAFGKPEILDAQDSEGKTALMRAVANDNVDIIKALLEKGADPCLVDCRGHSALYWAVREARMEGLAAVVTALENHEHYTSVLWDVAVHGAVASMRPYALEMLLVREDVDVDYVEPDGWTTTYTAQQCSPESEGIVSILRERSSHKASTLIKDLRRPSRWHPKDRYPALEIAPDGVTVNVLERSSFNSWVYQAAGAVRADYPMLPLYKDKVFYFEVRLIKVTERGSVHVGFCEDKASLEGALGWSKGSWGFHSDDGCLFENGYNPNSGNAYYGKPCNGEGKVIGCGVNFSTRQAFYTVDGTAVGRAFDHAICGKLYPAVSVLLDSGGWELVVGFPGEDGRSDDFVYKGDLEGEDLTRDPIKDPWNLSPVYEGRSRSTSHSTYPVPTGGLDQHGPRLQEVDEAAIHC